LAWVAQLSQSTGYPCTRIASGDNKDACCNDDENGNIDDIMRKRRTMMKNTKNMITATTMLIQMVKTMISMKLLVYMQ